MNNKTFLIFSFFSGALAVILGAMGAHYLKSKVAVGLITEQQISSFDTGVKYQMYHTLLLLIISLFPVQLNPSLLKFSGYFIITGIVLFSGSIYLLSTGGLHQISNIKVLGPVTPIGGLCFITAWILLLVAAVKIK